MLCSTSSTEILRCIHIGLLCVQNNMGDRPTMSDVSLMLSSISMTLDAPFQPAFFTQSRAMLLSEPSQGSASDQSNGRSCSTNDISLTELYPRWYRIIGSIKSIHCYDFIEDSVVILATWKNFLGGLVV